MTLRQVIQYGHKCVRQRMLHIVEKKQYVLEYTLIEMARSFLFLSSILLSLSPKECCLETKRSEYANVAILVKNYKQSSNYKDQEG